MVSRADLHRLVDALPDEELSEVGELLRSRSRSNHRLERGETDADAERAERLEHVVATQVAAMKHAVEGGPRSITVHAFVDVLRAEPGPDQQFEQDLRAIRRGQGMVEPVDWPS